MWIALLLVLLVAPVAAGAQAGPEAQGAEAPAKTSTPPDLDSLLKLPDSEAYSIDRRGGRTPGEWRGLFAELRERLAHERKQLELAKAQLDDTASKVDAWKMSTPIAGLEVQDAGENPIDFQLRQRIRRHKAEIDRLERNQRELEIEANLAGVPEDWRT